MLKGGGQGGLKRKNYRPQVSVEKITELKMTTKNQNKNKVSGTTAIITFWVIYSCLKGIIQIKITKRN